jgi:hypothetical protein
LENVLIVVTTGFPGLALVDDGALTLTGICFDFDTDVL